MQKSLTDAQVIDFSLQHDHIFGDELRTKHSWSRVVSLANFSNLILKLGIYEQKHVGVVSGTINEPELNFINSKKTTILSYEENKIFDLETDWKLNMSFDFSLTICNQVLEHVFNPYLAFSNLCHATKKGGIFGYHCLL